MTATTTMGTGNGSVENSLPRIQNVVRAVNLANRAVTAKSLDRAPAIVSSATATANEVDHANRVVVLDRAAGITLTLPTSTGSGNVYKFVIGTAVSSNSTIVKVANSTDVMAGRCYMLQDGGDTMVGFETAGTSDTVTLNGSTTGGKVGDVVEIVDVKSGLFLVTCHLTGTGTEATPFSATV